MQTVSIVDILYEMSKSDLRVKVRKNNLVTRDWSQSIACGAIEGKFYVNWEVSKVTEPTKTLEPHCPLQVHCHKYLNVEKLKTVNREDPEKHHTT